MQSRLSKILLLSILLLLSLAACQSQSAETEDGPAAAYWEYYEACQNGKYDRAKRLLTEEAKAQIEAIGVCGFTHDAINRAEVGGSETEHTFSDDPVLDINGARAVMTWIDEQGNLAIVNLINDVEGWKVAYTIWSN